MKFVFYKIVIKKYFFMLFILLTAGQFATAQEKVLYITYGRQSPLASGDANYKQAFFIKIPESAPDNFYVRIFDADCYGAVDQEVSVYNTETIFSLYGDKDIFAGENLLFSSIDKIESGSGKLLFKKLYSNDFDIDNKWITFTHAKKQNGELVNGYYYFKLLVEGGYGTDGNIYDIFVSRDPDSNQPIKDAVLYSYSPTLRNNKLNELVQVKFFDSFDGKYVIHDFDMDGAALNYDTPFRTGLLLNASGDAEWSSSIIELNEYEKGNFIGINFGRFKELKNDITLSVTGNNSNLIPIPLPVFYKKHNNKPVPGQQVFSSEQWNVKTFDASLSKDADGDEMQYTWYFGDGSTAAGMKVEHSYEKSGEYNCTLIVKDNSGNVDNSSMLNFTVKLNQPPAANAGNDILVSSSEVNFDASASSDPDGKIINYFWNFGDGSTGSGIQTKHVYPNPGTYKVSLQVTDDSQLLNDKNSTSITVTINKKPIADAGPDIITEPGKEIKFNGNNSVDPDGNIISYNWDFADGSTAEGVETVHTFSKAGKYTVRLEVLDNTKHQTAIDFDEVIVTVNAAPVAVAGTNIIAAPDQEIEFNGNKSVDYDGNKLNYMWEFSDGLYKSEKQILKRSFAKPGLYKSTLTVTDNSGALNNKSTDEINIRINNSPTAKLGGDILTCNPVVNFDASASFDPDGDLLKYTWDFGDGSTKVNGIKVLHEYKSKGSFPVVLTVDDGTGLSNSQNSVSISVIINQAPVADAGEDLVICAGEFVPFDGGKSYDPEKGLLKYFWDFGDGTTAEGINPVKNFYKSGIYQVKLIIEDDSGLECNKDIDTKLITVIESPVANAGDDIEVCAFEEVQFDGTKSTDADGVVNSYTWDFGDGTTGGGAAPKHTYTKAGIYKVVLSITGETQGDCDNSSADELTVTVNEAPEAEFTLPASAPINTQVKFDASSSNGKHDKIVSYEWDFGDGTTGTGKTITHTFANSGLYFVKLKVTADSKSNCNSSAIINSILINEAPVAIAEAGTKIKINNPINFSALKSYDSDGAITNYKWNFGDGTTAEGVYAEHIYNKTGKYKVTLEVKDNTSLSNNSAKDEITIEVYEGFKINISSKDLACPEQEIKFTSTLSPFITDSLVSYNWEFSDGISLEGKEVLHSFSKPGNYNVTLVVESSLFDNGDAKIFSKNIKINSAPIIDVQKIIYACPGEEVVLDASKSFDADGDKLKFTWQINDFEKAGQKVSYNFTKAGEHLIKLVVEDDSNTGCNSAQEEIKIIINSPPVCITGKNIQGFTGGAYDGVLFDASKSYDEDGDALTYEWDFGDGEKGYGSKVFHNYIKTGNYNAVLKISDGKNSKCGESLVKILVTVKKR